MFSADNAWIGEPSAATRSRWSNKAPSTAETASGKIPRAGKAQRQLTPWIRSMKKAGGNERIVMRRNITVELTLWSLEYGGMSAGCWIVTLDCD